MTPTLIAIIVSFCVVVIAAIVAIVIQANKLTLLRLQLKHDEDNNKISVSHLEDAHEAELKELENLFKAKVEKHNEECDIYEKYLDTFQKYFVQLSSLIHLSNDRIKEIDVKQIFKADDEIGFFFENIKVIQEALNAFDFTKPETRYKPKPIAAPSPIGPDGKAIVKDGDVYIPFDKVMEMMSKEK